MNTQLSKSLCLILWNAINTFPIFIMYVYLAYSYWKFIIHEVFLKRVMDSKVNNKDNVSAFIRSKMGKSLLSNEYYEKFRE